MNKKYVLASTPILLAVICFIIAGMGGSSVAADGRLIEPYFFMIPIGYLLFFGGIISLLFVAIISTIKKSKIIK
ncbi:DUF3955 domain-containing protein [Paenibacillus sp. KQZ6P-2]|uniref:DUF3955 domain-containing protein n=1 Tax=Paenibacillus mangrovi TaxID=2931978 RepID=A0A9X1WRY5_9BACL|nr:DUF3955 domain-containing protein [Paenibacillus mangrovi]